MPPISYRPRLDVTLGRERASLAAALSILFEDENAAARPGDGEDNGNKDLAVLSANEIIQRHA